jgi:Zn-dependent peptidase ImmA (M78 family)/DNA-binding XRE family transcriptional regulator
MKEIFAKRLKAARLLAGLSQDKLVDAIGHMVSKNAIAKYERAEMMPNSQVLIALAKALSVKPDYFFRPFTVEIGQVEFRKKSKLGARKLKVLQQQVSDQIERYLEIESLLDISSKFDNPIGHLLISKGEDVEKAVNTLLESWKIGINALPNVIELLEDKEIKVIEIEADLAFDGLSGWANGEIPVIVLNRGYPIERKRFTALHELGHLLMHVKKNLSPKEMEKLCHRFAGAMLMPKETFITELGEHRSSFSLPELIAIKENYGLSVQAIMARAKDLGVINDSTYIRFRKFVNHNRQEAGWGKYLGKEQSDRFMQLVHRAASENIISMSKAANLAGKKLAEFRNDMVSV